MMISKRITPITGKQLLHFFIILFHVWNNPHNGEATESFSNIDEMPDRITPITGKQPNEGLCYLHLHGNNPHNGEATFIGFAKR